MPSNVQSRLYAAFDGDPAPILDFLAWRCPGRPRRVLDVGCGPGRLLPGLAQLGWPALGLEPDPDYLEQARAVGAGLPGMAVQQGGFGSLKALGGFDLVLAANGPLAYLLGEDEREDAARRVFAALEPGGLFVTDLANFPWLLRNYRAPADERAKLDGREVTRRIRHELDFHEGVWTHEDVFEVAGETAPTRVCKTHRFAMLGFPEVRRILRGAGFAPIETYPSYRARRQGRLDGPRMVVCAVRSAVTCL